MPTSFGHESLWSLAHRLKYPKNWSICFNLVSGQMLFWHCWRKYARVCCRYIYCCRLRNTKGEQPCASNSKSHSNVELGSSSNESTVCGTKQKQGNICDTGS